MVDVRQRKPAPPPSPPPAAVREEKERDDSKHRARGPAKLAPVDFEPDLVTLTVIFLAFAATLGSLLFYKIDNASDGPFAGWVNARFPAIDRALNNGKGTFPLFGAAAAETAERIRLTEAELRAYDGTDPERPLYLAIDGTIFDVSAAPAFYGPGGHYHHFVGKDATRAWVTECWDAPEQFTWRLDDVHVMFLPTYLDEQLEDVAQGRWDPTADEKTSGVAGFGMPKEAMLMMAKKSMERFGSVTDGEKARRRAADAEAAEAQVRQVVAKWFDFFAASDKYPAVGEVIRDTDRPAPPVPCEAAMKKRPLKGGKLESLMGSMSSLKDFGGPAAGGAGDAGATDAEPDADGMPAGMPESVKAQIRAAKEAAAAKDAGSAAADADASAGDTDGEETAHDEL